jgi:putative sugar O-methyltransferase
MNGERQASSTRHVKNLMPTIKRIPKLDQALQALDRQNAIYQPTVFWREASLQIAREMAEAGVENFRRLPTALGYFVPNYSGSASGIQPEQADCLRTAMHTDFPQASKSHQALDHFLSGKQAALADYRVLLASAQEDQWPKLLDFSESPHGQPVEQFEWDGRRYSRSALNYLLGLSFLKKHLGGDVPRTLLEIGGGFGTLGEIWSQSGIADWRYIDIDIPPTQFAADNYLKATLGTAQVSGFDELPESGLVAISTLKPASVLCSWQIEQLQGEIDLFVNFISFQEMEPAVVENYLHHVRRLKSRWILLRNLREGKQKKNSALPGVEQPMRSGDYTAMLSGYDLVASNVHPFGFQTVDGFHSELLLFRRQ